MATISQKPLFGWDQIEALGDLRPLKLVLDNLPDEAKSSNSNGIGAATIFPSERCGTRWWPGWSFSIPASRRCCGS